MNRFIEEPRGLFRRTYRKPDRKNGARTFYWTMAILMLAVAVITVVLCLWFVSTGSENAGTTGGSSVPGISSDGGSADTGSPDTSSDLPGSASPESGSSLPETSDTSSQENTSETTLILAAEQAFGKNSLDAHHTEAMNNADTMTEMLSVYDETLDAWRKQLDTLTAKLESYTTEDYKAQNSAWKQNAAEKIRKQEEVLSNQGGTIQQLELAEYTCMLYRQRALELFTVLYRYENTYIF